MKKDGLIFKQNQSVFSCCSPVNNSEVQNDCIWFCTIKTVQSKGCSAVPPWSRQMAGAFPSRPQACTEEVTAFSVASSVLFVFYALWCAGNIQRFYTGLLSDLTKRFYNYNCLILLIAENSTPAMPDTVILRVKNSDLCEDKSCA